MQLSPMTIIYHQLNCSLLICRHSSTYQVLLTLSLACSNFTTQMRAIPEALLHLERTVTPMVIYLCPSLLGNGQKHLASEEWALSELQSVLLEEFRILESSSGSHKHPMASFLTNTHNTSQIRKKYPCVYRSGSHPPSTCTVRS